MRVTQRLSAMLRRGAVLNPGRWLLAAIPPVIGFLILMRRTFGTLTGPISRRFGNSWPAMVRALQVLTLFAWIGIWLSIDDQRRGELQSFFVESLRSLYLWPGSGG